MAVQFQIQFTSSSEGITLGVVGDDWMSCLLALSDEFGDGILPLYEKTRDEMGQVFRAVEEAFAEEVKDAKGRQSRQAAAVVAEQPELEDPGVEDPDGGGGDEDRDDVDGGTGSGDPDPVANPDHVCAICSAEITADLAEASEMMHGEPRCKSCMP